MLTPFDPHVNVLVTTDASACAIGAVLEQETEAEIWPVAYVSRMLKAAECSYLVHNRELLEIVDTLWVWRLYPHGYAFTLFTYDYPFKYITTQKYLSHRQIQWLEQMVSFSLKIIPVSGKNNKVADSLSRQNVFQECGNYENQELLLKAN